MGAACAPADSAKAAVATAGKPLRRRREGRREKKMTHETWDKYIEPVLNAALVALFLWMLFMCAGCAGNDPALLSAVNSNGAKLVELDAWLELNADITAGFKNDFQGWFEGMTNTINDRHSENAETLNRQFADIKGEIGSVSQSIRDFRGTQNVGWFSGGGIWVALVAVAAFYLIPSPLQRRRKSPIRKYKEQLVENHFAKKST